MGQSVMSGGQLCITPPHHTQTHTSLQATVHIKTSVYYHWQDYQNFTNKEEIDSAISEFVTQLKQVQPAAKDANIQSKQEEEEKSLMCQDLRQLPRERRDR